jgi:mevalonate kinase
MGRPQYYFVISPHKVILFGEHSVVYGGSAISTAINLQSLAFFSEKMILQRSGYIDSVMKLSSCQKGYVNIVSPVAQGRGLGSSAVTVAASLKLLSSTNRKILAFKSFNIERRVQGAGSPIDTSTVIFGGTLSVNMGSEKPLFKVGYKGVSWEFKGLKCKPLDLIIVDSGERPRTAEIVSKVKIAVNRNDTNMEIFRRIDSISREAKKYLVNDDTYELGRLMNENHEELKKLGLSTPVIERVKKIGDRLALGSKMTGAGLGGFVIILPRKDKQKEIIKELIKLGLRYNLVKTNAQPLVRHTLVR